LVIFEGSKNIQAMCWCERFCSCVSWFELLGRVSWLFGFRMVFVNIGLTPRWSQRRLPLEFMDGLGYTTVIEPEDPLARRRGSALDR
jgi:hypothetical protein